MRRLGLGLLLAALAAGARDPGALTLLGPDYPRVFHFRASEAAWNPRAYPTYESWEATFDGLMGIMGKCLDEECLGREPRNPEFFSRFKQRHPAQAVLLHVNGNSRDPLYQRQAFFPGHWIYRRAVMITADVPAEAGESVIHVADTTAFRVGTGRYRTSADDIALFALRDGRHDWDHAEEVQLLRVDAAAGTLTVRRGCYGTTPLAFRQGQARAAAHAVEGPWGPANHLLWFYNYATHCPRDRAGRTCADVLVDDLARRFAADGALAAFDGLEFDVLFSVTQGDTDGDGAEDDGVADGRNRYAIGVLEFVRALRARLGPDVLLQADGALGPGGTRSQRAAGSLNGIESEGWPNLNDWDLEDWSGGLNRLAFWQANAHAPAFSYINHKWIEPVPGRPGESHTVEAPFSRHRLVFAAAQFCDAMLCSSAPPGNAAGSTRPGGPAAVWDEFVQGRDRTLGWLGPPEAPAVRLASRAPDLLEGKGQGDALARRIEGRVDLAVSPAGVEIRPRDPGARDLRFAIRRIAVTGPDLVAVVAMRASPMAGYPAEMPRLARVGVSGGLIDLLDAPPDQTGMCLRGGSERPIDPASGATAVSGPRTVGGTALPTLFAHPPWKHGTGYTFWVREADVPPDAELRFSIGMGERSPERSDGVWFRVTAAVVQAEGLAPAQTLIETHSKAHQWLPQHVTLAPYAGQRVRFTFVADAGPADDATTDHAHWGQVRIVPAGADESRLTAPRDAMTWVNARSFASTVYHPTVRSSPVDLSFAIEGPEPVVVESLALYAHPDAMVRAFAKGLVLANPSRQPYRFDLQALSPGRAYRRLAATPGQDAVANSGEPVAETVTLGERDALFLLLTR